MAKLTKTQQAEMQRIINYMNEVKKFIMSDRTQVCHEFLGDFKPINKEFGSELQYLDRAMDTAQWFLENYK